MDFSAALDNWTAVDLFPGGYSSDRDGSSAGAGRMLKQAEG